MIYLQRLAESVNMAYVNITLDVGAAINAFKMVWNHPEVFKNVVIHLGGFHFLKENFQVSKYSLIKKYNFNITIDIFALISLHFIYRVAYYCLTYTYVKVEG